MIQTASILWAVLADPMASVILASATVVACAGWGFSNWCGKKIFVEAKGIVKEAYAIAAQRDTWRGIAIDLEDRLRKIEQSRHNSAKHARACQLTKQREAIAARTAELQQNISDRTSKDDRMAA